ncbi:Protein PPP5D1 [Plecturocebus cupreus]
MELIDRPEASSQRAAQMSWRTARCTVPRRCHLPGKPAPLQLGPVAMLFDGEATLTQCLAIIQEFVVLVQPLPVGRPLEDAHDIALQLKHRAGLLGVREVGGLVVPDHEECIHYGSSKMESFYVAHASLELQASTFLLPQPPKRLGLQGLTLSPRLECHVTMAHCSLDLLSSSDPPTSASQVAVTTGTWHHAWLILKCFVETGSRYVARAGLRPLGSSDPLTSTFQREKSEVNYSLIVFTLGPGT